VREKERERERFENRNRNRNSKGFLKGQKRSEQSQSGPGDHAQTKGLKIENCPQVILFCCGQGCQIFLETIM
jgi:hypothetical protein